MSDLLGRTSGVGKGLRLDVKSGRRKSRQIGQRTIIDQPRAGDGRRAAPAGAVLPQRTEAQAQPLTHQRPAERARHRGGRAHLAFARAPGHA